MQYTLAMNESLYWRLQAQFILPFITPDKKVMFYPTFVGQLSMSVCRVKVYRLCPTAHNQTAIFIELYTHVGTSPCKNLLDFGSHRGPDPDPGIFEGFFNNAR